jgi:hypothetical protein
MSRFSYAHAGRDMLFGKGHDFIGVPLFQIVQSPSFSVSGQMV